MLSSTGHLFTHFIFHIHELIGDQFVQISRRYGNAWWPPELIESQTDLYGYIDGPEPPHQHPHSIFDVHQATTKPICDLAVATGLPGIAVTLFVFDFIIYFDCNSRKVSP